MIELVSVITRISAAHPCATGIGRVSAYTALSVFNCLSDVVGKATYFVESIGLWDLSRLEVFTIKFFLSSFFFIVHLSSS